ncbi:TonB-dependent receptor domain-containing protein [Glaciecola sp. MF2-115]|uniref:TonB-dependent receptor domain-containing protein n=1 Tax=Glaciecola sp. MF2-115 TaxID=3384827 RepID=UPI0039A21A5C
MNQSNDTKLHKVSLAVLVALGCLAAPNLYAQETDSLLEEEEEEVKEVVERISVTGSRIKRQEFSNASPIQIISGDISRELGMFDTSEMLQSSSQSSGQQIDNTFSGFVLDNGPGAATVGFRGLGAARTLVLINGRRVAPAGVGGAPTSPDLNLIPSVLIDRVENLFDGASTVYGSDAIAGVANVILRSNVEGFDVQATVSAPKDGGEQTILSAMYGVSGDNYSFNIAAEYNERRSQTFGQSEFVGECTEFYYEGDDGEIYTDYRGIGPNPTPPDACDIFPLSNRMSIPFHGSIYRTEGSTNIGIPNWSDSTSGLANAPFFGDMVTEVDTNGDGIIDNAIWDGNGDGLLDFNFQDPFYSLERSDYVNTRDWVSPLKRLSIYANGDYLLQDDNDTRFFYEALYAQRDSNVFSPGGQLFEFVGADNPFNPCGTDPINGIDCRAGVGFPYGPQEVRPIISIKGDRDTNVVDVHQYRVVGGVQGNIGALEDFGQGNWSYEVSAIYSASKGDNSIIGINEANLLNSLDTSVRNDDGSITCGNGSDGCVPVNLFSSNIYQLGGGVLTPAEAGYLFDSREISTEVKQTMLTGYISGDAFTLPWNDQIVPLVLGAEFRKDEIITDANPVAAEGLLWGYFSDEGADGSRNLQEVFFETEAPLLRGEEWAEELTVTASGRWTNETFYDPETTFSLKAIYRPTEWFTIRGTRGTSYRAPNLRERFLNGTSGFASISDPCVVPDSARISDPLDLNANETYDASEDQRAQRILDSCVANGVDPTSLGLQTDTTDRFGAGTSTEVSTGGSDTLAAEQSVSETYGFIFEQPFTDAFDLTLSATWYDIRITDSVAEPSGGFIVSNCYNNIERPDGSSAFCGSINRNSTTNRLESVDASFINIGLEGSKGVDFNIFYQQDFVVGENELGVTFDLIATKLQSAEQDILGQQDDNFGEPTYPEWRGNARVNLSYMDFRFNWSTRYIGKGEADQPADFDTYAPCDGLDVLCRPVYYTDDYYTHNASISYSQDNWAVTVGVRNVFNDAPPKVDDAGVFSTRNIPLGVGYDLFGRTVFGTVSYSF